nr:MetaGeneMark_Unknown Function [uncultured bacterium]
MAGSEARVIGAGWGGAGGDEAAEEGVGEAEDGVLGVKAEAELFPVGGAGMSMVDLNEGGTLALLQEDRLRRLGEVALAVVVAQIVEVGLVGCSLPHFRRRHL